MFSSIIWRLRRLLNKFLNYVNGKDLHIQRTFKNGHQIEIITSQLHYEQKDQQLVIQSKLTDGELEFFYVNIAELVCAEVI